MTKEFTELDSRADENSRVLIIAWISFNKKFKSVEDCYEYLFVKLEENNQTNCKHCGHKIERKEYGQRVFTCDECGKQFWLTSGTLFEKTRKLKSWFAVIWLLENGVSFNPNTIQKLTGIAYSTAWEIFKRVSLVINGYIEKRSVLIPSSEFTRLFCKRSILTPNEMHPRHELDESKANYIANSNPKDNTEKINKNSCNQGTNNTDDSSTAFKQNLSDPEETVLNLLTNEPISFEKICTQSCLSPKEVSATLSLLEIGQHIEILSGNQFKLNSNANSKKNNTNSLNKDTLDSELLYYADLAIERIKDIHHGISRKYLQNYIALLWCQHSTERWGRGRIFEACWKSSTITYKQILDYVSPYYIEIAMSACKPRSAIANQKQ